MTVVAEYNITALSALDQARYQEVAELGFVEVSKWGIVVSDQKKKLLLRTRTHRFTTPTGITDPVTTPITPGPGEDFPYTKPGANQGDVSWDTYPKSVRVDQASEQGSVIELINSTMTQILQCAAGTFDYHAAKAAISSTMAKTFHYVGQTARADITASNRLTLSDARIAHARLTKSQVPPFMVPGIGPVYIAMIHPFVAHDLKNSSTNKIFEGAIQVHHPNFRANVLGYEAGFLWIETGTHAIVLEGEGASTGTSTPNVDVYCTMFMGDQCLGMVHSPVAPTHLVDEIPLNAQRSMVARISYPQGHLGMVKEIGMLANIGFGLIHPEGTYRVESAASLDNSAS